MKNKFDELKTILSNSKSIVLTTHMIPDGDAIGSELAIYEYLKAKKKNVKIINHSPTPDNLVFLDKRKIIKYFREDIDKYTRIINEADTLLILDTNEYSRLKSMENILSHSKAKKVCIDHHLGSNHFDLLISNTNYPATSQILYEFICNDNPKYITHYVAECLYSGIMTDTGSFRYPRTDEKTFLICADLIKRGVDPVKIYDQIYCNIAKGKVNLLARFIESFTFHFNDTVVLGVVTKRDFSRFHSDVQDVEGFSSFIMNIKNIKVGIVLVELKDGIKISFRSKGNIKMNEFAKIFGGGGHKNAAGGTIVNKTIKQAKEEILKKYKKFSSN
jgi:bifunctional oligoribonuclease and PAP phosphatase NrnA